MARIHLKKREGKSVLLETAVDSQTGRPFVIEGDRHYDKLTDLLAAHPELCAADQLTRYCELCLHFYPGPGCLLIEDADEFRDRYEALLGHGADSANNMPSAADFGPFDVGGIGEPQVIDGALVFYAESILYSVPYRVEAPWHHREGEQVKFLLLPLRE